MKTKVIIPIFVPHKGCPNQCIFCNQRKISGQIKDITKEDVLNTIDEHLKTIKGEVDIELAFFGGSFTGIDRNLMIELLEAANIAIEKNLIGSIRLSTRPDYINHEILQILKKYNVKTIELGVQSMDDEVLELNKRGHTSKDVENASKLIKEYGFILGHQVMIGLYGDTELKDIETVNKLIRLQPDIARIYPVMVIKDTPLCEMYEKGEFISWSLEKYVIISKKLLLLFQKNGINVIRVGLQATDNIALHKDIKSESYHPAFRELVESSILYDMFAYYIEHLGLEESTLEIIVNPSQVSKVIGQRGSNIKELKENFKLENLHISQKSGLNKNEYILKTANEEYKLNYNDYIKLI